MTLPRPGESITLTSADDPRIPAGYRIVIRRAETPNPVLQRQFSEYVMRLAQDIQHKAEPTPTAS